MPGLLELLLGGGNPQLRLGGEDTPAGGGVLDMLGQRIMQQQMNPQMGGAAPLNAQPAQQPTQNPGPAVTQNPGPRVSMPQQGGGGLLGRLFGGGGSAGKNSTVQWLVNKGYDPGAAQAIASDPQTLRAAMMQAGSPGNNDPLDAEYKRAQIDNMRSQISERNNPNARDQFGLQPIYGKDENGNVVVMQPSKAGGLVKANIPAGVELTPGVDRIDLGDSWAITDRNGDVKGVIPKNLEEAASQTAAGRAKGEDAASYESLSSKMPGLEKVVTDLDKLSHEATYTTAGVAYDSIARQMGMEPREAAVARAKYKAMVDNQVLPLLRDTFGAQFTVAEGESLRATLGNPDLSPPEKQEVLKAFIEQKRRDVEALGNRTGRTAPGSERMGTAGEWTDAGNGVKIRRKQ